MYILLGPVTNNGPAAITPGRSIGTSKTNIADVFGMIALIVGGGGGAFSLWKDNGKAKMFFGGGAVALFASVMLGGKSNNLFNGGSVSSAHNPLAPRPEEPTAVASRALLNDNVKKQEFLSRINGEDVDGRQGLSESSTVEQRRTFLQEFSGYKTFEWLNEYLDKRSNLFKKRGTGSIPDDCYDSKRTITTGARNALHLISEIKDPNHNAHDPRGTALLYRIFGDQKCFPEARALAGELLVANEREVDGQVISNEGGKYLGKERISEKTPWEGMFGWRGGNSFVDNQAVSTLSANGELSLDYLGQLMNHHDPEIQKTSIKTLVSMMIDNPTDELYDEFFQNLGSHKESSVYKTLSGGNADGVLDALDDLVVTGENVNNVERFIKSLRERFKIDLSIDKKLNNRINRKMNQITCDIGFFDLEQSGDYHYKLQGAENIADHGKRSDIRRLFDLLEQNHVPGRVIDIDDESCSTWLASSVGINHALSSSNAEVYQEARNNLFGLHGNKIEEENYYAGVKNVLYNPHATRQDKQLAFTELLQNPGSYDNEDDFIQFLTSPAKAHTKDDVKTIVSYINNQLMSGGSGKRVLRACIHRGRQEYASAAAGKFLPAVDINNLQDGERDLVQTIAGNSNRFGKKNAKAATRLLERLAANEQQPPSSADGESGDSSINPQNQITGLEEIQFLGGDLQLNNHGAVSQAAYNLVRILASQDEYKSEIIIYITQGLKDQDKIFPILDGISKAANDSASGVNCPNNLANLGAVLGGITIVENANAPLAPEQSMNYSFNDLLGQLGSFSL